MERAREGGRDGERERPGGGGGNDKGGGDRRGLERRRDYWVACCKL